MGFGGSPGQAEWPNSYDNAVVQVLAGLFGNSSYDGVNQVYRWTKVDGTSAGSGPSGGATAFGSGMLSTALGEDIPYDTLAPYDPDPDDLYSDPGDYSSPLADVDTKLSTATTTVNAFDPDADWESAFEKTWYRLKGADVDGAYSDLFADPDITATVSAIATAAVADFANVLNTSTFRTDATALADTVNASTELSISIDVANNAIDKAVQYAVKSVNSFPIEALVQGIESRTLPAHYRQLSRFNAGMADINAVQTSTFVQANQMHWAMFQQNISESVTEFARQLYTIIATQFSQTVTTVFQSEMQNRYGVATSAFNAQIGGYTQVFGSKVAAHLGAFIQSKVQTDSDAHRIMQAGVEQQMQHQRIKAQLQQNDTATELQFAQVLMIAMRQKASDTLEHEIRRITWDFSLLKTGFDALAAPMGAVGIPPKEGWGDKLIGGLSSGAGALLASKVG